MSEDEELADLAQFVQALPAVQRPVGKGGKTGDYWWLKFSLDIEHPLAWSVVQELGHILNYVSTEERLPTVFMPVSPPPYMNGGPRDFLSWVIENKSVEFGPRKAREWLEGRLPKPAHDPEAWKEPE